MKYLNQFLGLKSAPDILAAAPTMHKAPKEIGEAMAVMKQARQPILSRPMHYSLLDLCAGNALGSLLAIYTLPLVSALAVDLKPRNGNYHLAKRFTYMQGNIYDTELECSHSDSSDEVMIAIHPCKRLASRCFEIAHARKSVQHAYIMPCCNDPRIVEEMVPSQAAEHLGSYRSFALALALKYGGKYKVDKHAITPKNIVVEWHRSS